MNANALDALDTLAKSNGRMTAAVVGLEVGRPPQSARRTLKALVRDLAVDVRNHRYQITGRGRALLERRTAPGDFPRGGR